MEFDGLVPKRDRESGSLTGRRILELADNAAREFIKLPDSAPSSCILVDLEAKNY
jgi:hypothetical protein